MTPTDIARLRLINRQMTHASFRTPGEVVAHMGAVQAQDFPGSKWAVGLRLPAAMGGLTSLSDDPDWCGIVRLVGFGDIIVGIDG